MDNATLVDVFRTEEESCLLGTDAMRDGVDVPGRALRLVVFEKVPWPRPDILHRERRIHLSGGDPKGYDDRIARLRLRQAFGRLIRRATDRGVFVLLDRQTPSRLLSAFPAGVAVRRVGLAEAVAETRAFLGEPLARLNCAWRFHQVRGHVKHRSFTMRPATAWTRQRRWFCTMVLVAAADGGMTDREIGVMAGQVQTLPVFHDFTTEQLDAATDAAVKLLNEEDGLQHAGAADPRRARAAAARDGLCAGLRGGRGDQVAPAADAARCWNWC